MCFRLWRYDCTVEPLLELVESFPSGLWKRQCSFCWLVQFSESLRVCMQRKKIRRTYAKGLMGIFHDFVVFFILLSIFQIFYNEHFIYTHEKGKKHGVVTLWSCSLYLQALADTVLDLWAGVAAVLGRAQIHFHEFTAGHNASKFCLFKQ